jgi:hypothetical protein
MSQALSRLLATPDSLYLAIERSRRTRSASTKSGHFSLDGLFRYV